MVVFAREHGSKFKEMMTLAHLFVIINKTVFILVGAVSTFRLLIKSSADPLVRTKKKQTNCTICHECVALSPTLCLSGFHLLSYDELYLFFFYLIRESIAEALAIYEDDCG